MNWEDCERDACKAYRGDCDDCVDGSEYTEVCPREDDCMADRDYCCDCCGGDKYRSPDSYKEDR